MKKKEAQVANSRTAVIVTAYGLAYGFAEPGKERLTFMSYRSAVVAADVAIKEAVPKVILSAAYDTWEKEFVLKKAVLTECGVNEDKIEHLGGGIIDSFDEMEKTRDIVSKYEITRLILVVEFWHALRARLICRAVMPDVELRVVTFTAPRYERAHESHPVKLLGWLKSIRAAYASLWITWNVLMTALTPFIIIRRSFRSRGAGLHRQMFVRVPRIFPPKREKE